MDVKATLERLTPEPGQLPHWDAVLRDAGPSRARRAVARVAVVAAVVGLAAFLAVAPWREAERTGLLDRALAAVGDGEVLHVVFRGEWGGTVVDLDTGRRTPAYGEREVWYDPDRNLVHQISRLGGTVEREELYRRNPGDKELTTLWQDYRRALQSGTARLLGEDVVDGVPVQWIIVRSQMLPDVADGRDHEFAQQVAISTETYKPAAMRYTRDRKAPTGATERILLYETISVDEADFTKAQERSLDGTAFREGRERIALEQAADVLGRTPYWLGRRHEGLPLAQVSRLEIATSVRKTEVLRGNDAALARQCIAGIRRRARAGRPVRRPHACRSLGRSFEFRGDTVLGHGPLQLKDVSTGVVLFYGSLGDDPTTYRVQSVPRFDKPFVSITQATEPAVMLHGMPTKYAPPEGTVLVTATRSGYLIVDGMHISIHAGSEASVIAAARALRPLGD